MPEGGSCLLGSINLSAFVKNAFTDKAFFDMSDFERSVSIAIKALNDVLDEGIELHPLKEQRQSAKDWRQIGLGIMGLADMLIKLGLTYGSTDSLSLCNEIGWHMADTAISASAKLAKKYGVYPKYNYNMDKCEFFLNNTSKHTRELVKKYGLRNSQLLTCAPTGSISTMLGISGGIEPIFANSYVRKTESLHDDEKYYKVMTPIVQEYLNRHNLKDESDLPDYFITALQIPYRNRIDMQSVWQQHIDASISSTINLPYDTSKISVCDVYLYAWEKELKGITIYREGCEREGILTTKIKEKTVNNNNVLKRGDILDVSDDLIGYKRKLTTGCGGIHFETYFDEFNGEPYETFINIGSAGSCERLLQGLSRMISLSLRSGVPIEAVIDQLTSIRPCNAYAMRSKTKGDTSKGSSCPAAIGYALEELYKKNQDRCFADVDEADTNIAETNENILEKPKNIPLCPECGEPIIFEGGCVICKNCGYSKCD